ncbi:MAG: ATP-binding protein [Saprospiraceae bacterium]
MNYLASVRTLLQTDSNSKITELANLLIPQLMYIPNKEVIEIQSLLNSISDYPLIENDQFLLQICISFLEYKKQNYEAVFKKLDENTLNKFNKINTDILVAYFSAVGVSLRSLGRIDEALSVLQKAIDYGNLEITQPFSQFCYVISVYQVAEMYGELQDYNAMLNKHLQLYHLVQNWNIVDIENRSLNGIAKAYIGLEQFENALVYLKKAAKKSKKKANIPFLARNCHDLGFVHFRLQKFEIAIDYYQKALQIRQENGLTNAVTTTLIDLGKVYIAQEKWQLGIDTFNEALKTAKQHKAKRKIATIYEKLSFIYENLKQSDKALFYFKAFYHLKNEIDNIQRTQIENQQVRETNAELERQKNLLAAQTQKLETTLEKLQITNKYLENFAAVAAHDLKAPIRIASNFAKLIERKYGKLVKEDAEYFQFISTNIQRLSRMIDDLLALSKLDQGLSTPKSVRFEQIIEEVQSRLNEKIEHTNAILTLPKSMPLLKGHDSLLSQLFQNFIDNAIKYKKSYTNPEIIIDVQLDKKTKYYQFEVHDNGKGIETSLQPYIFELFNGSYRKDSSGIGLATCKKIVKHYGGDIWLKSQEGIGTSIFFTLPAQEVI